ncbi:hypothetical protein [Dyadobacter sandarakinus]|uniref:Phage integrase SAM-like domain-containing protein n=1 Tax=Dyadobacter sandarakinus TaxID=2747268 RepID=A0ABX7I0Y7_9BACT|nr:hypothetical protein [Dyadobacter sandarakinus]QRQ99718.1 hypothetical protein HWI92_01700 [Dyadobacter sandarakinus]
MGISPSEFESITPYQFTLIRQGFTEKETLEWQRARFVAYVTYRMNVKDAVSIERFLPLDEQDQKAAKKASKRKMYTKKQEAILFDIFNPELRKKGADDTNQ